MKSKKTILAGAAALALAALALAAAYFYIPGGEAPAFSPGDIQVFLNEDGTVVLSWPEAQAALPEGTPADAPASQIFYRLSLRDSSEFNNGQPVKSVCDTNRVTLQNYALPLTVRVQAESPRVNLLGMPRYAVSPALEAEVAHADLSAPEAVAAPGPGTLSLDWKLSGETPDLYEVFTVEDGAAALAASTSEKHLNLKVGREGDIPLPSYGQPLTVHVRAAVQGEGYVLCGPASNQITVERQDLLGDDLNLTYQEGESLHYTLEWDETRGEYYELQEWTGEGWTLLETLEPAERLTAETGRLVSGSRHRYRVTAKDRNGTERSSEEVEFFASISPLYATVWPIIDQPFYDQPSQDGKSLAKISGGTALCVLEEQEDWFQVRYQDQYGWVDSRFCMINLPEYVGDHCAYDITNSYRSVFKVHENPIARITDQVVQGFEHIREADGGFLVPYLYPCAKKLLSAALAAEADGYRLKIYEAFRPNEATRFLYDTTAAQLDWAALVYEEGGGEFNDDWKVLDPVTGWEVDLSDGLLLDPETEEKISREDLALREAEEEDLTGVGMPAGAPEDGETPPPLGEGLMLGAVVPEEEAAEDVPFFTLPEDGEGGGLAPEPTPQQPVQPPAPQQPAPAAPQAGEAPPEGTENPEEPEEPEPEFDTYFKIMTNNGRFHLGSFLARVASAHNRGIALDLTLERIDTGEELEMQSAIHDLSWYSATYLNNDNAKLLEKYMTATGMRGLTSEWWHFQDDETRESIGLSSYLFKGVSMRGWTRDEQGWRYRDEDGSFLKNTTVSADGKRYTLNAEGYAAE